MQSLLVFGSLLLSCALLVAAIVWFFLAMGVILGAFSVGPWALIQSWEKRELRTFGLLLFAECWVIVTLFISFLLVPLGPLLVNYILGSPLRKHPDHCNQPNNDGLE
jgi:hypothetical protein